MKFRNSFEGRAQLRREQFNRSQTKSQISGKKSLTSRVIKDRERDITEDQLEKEMRIAQIFDKGEEVLAQIMYHLKFGASSYPSIFDEDYIAEIGSKLRRIKLEFIAGLMDEEKYIERLETIDELIKEDMNKLSNTI